MNKSILFFSDKIQKKYNIYLNYDICETIIDKINYNNYKINLYKERIKFKLRRINYLNNTKMCNSFDLYLLYKQKKYNKMLNNIIYNDKFRLNILNNK